MSYNLIMSFTLWRSPFELALKRNPQPNARYLQLSTIQVDGRPANRTIVFRGFLENTDQLKFFIDARSQKIAQIEHQPWAEACWYFPETREQFRIAGSLALIQADHPDAALQQARQTSWQALSDPTRLQFTWPYPGKPRAEAAAFELPPPNPIEPLPDFCLLLLEPMQVDHLELRGEPQNRWIYCRNDQTWSTQAINP